MFQTTNQYFFWLIRMYADVQPLPRLVIQRTHPRCSMYGIFTYIYPKNGPNVGKYSIHGVFGHGIWLAVCSVESNLHMARKSWTWQCYQTINYPPTIIHQRFCQLLKSSYFHGVLQLLVTYIRAAAHVRSPCPITHTPWHRLFPARAPTTAAHQHLTKIQNTAVGVSEYLYRADRPSDIDIP